MLAACSSTGQAPGPGHGARWHGLSGTAQLRAQYGLVPAGAFPPHATLVGSRHRTAELESIVDAVSRGIAGIERFPVSGTAPAATTSTPGGWASPAQRC